MSERQVIRLCIKNDVDNLEKWFEETVFRVLSLREDGTPDELRRLPFDDIAELVDGDLFIVGFLPDSGLLRYKGNKCNGDNT